MIYTDNLEQWTQWILRHRPEVQAFLASVEGMEMDQSSFVARFTELGLPRTAPSKGRRIFDFLVRVGFIRSNNQ